ncbi:MAG: hypothetical protein P4L22_01375 [Candidatus Babeliales bacterium]|nr:hypothetical protein [Candidatus Babeliales bacterium]
MNLKKIILVIIFNCYYIFPGATHSSPAGNIEYRIQPILNLYNNGNCKNITFNHVKVELQNLLDENEDYLDDIIHDNEEVAENILIIKYYIASINFKGFDGGRGQRLNIAVRLYLELFNQSIDEEIKILSAFYLGNIYYHLGSYSNAKIYLASAYGQEQRLEIKYVAAYYLGKIHYYGYDVHKNLELAELFFQESSQANPQITAKSKIYLDKIKPKNLL